MVEQIVDWTCPHCSGTGCRECKGKGGGKAREIWLSKEEALQRGLPIPREAFAFVIHEYPDSTEWWAVSAEGWALVRVEDRLHREQT